MRAFTGFLTQSPMSVPYYHDRGLAAWVEPQLWRRKSRTMFSFFPQLWVNMFSTPRQGHRAFLWTSSMSIQKSGPLTRR